MMLIHGTPRELSQPSAPGRNPCRPSAYDSRALVPVYRRVLPLVVLGALSAWAGCWYEVLVRRRGAPARPSRGDPGVPALSAR